MWWNSKQQEASNARLLRRNARIHNGWQFAIGSDYATNGITEVSCPTPPTGSGTVQRLIPTSSGLFCLTSADAGPLSLWRSSDGFEAYSEVLNSALVGRMNAGFDQLIDCGDGRLILVEYCTDQVPITNNTNLMFGSDDGGDTWSILIQTSAGSIRHFHTGFYDFQTDTLYIATGDANLQSSLLICDDVNDLLTNPSTWRTRWGLSDSLRSTIDTDYVVGYNSQDFRTISGAFLGDHFYWGVDSYTDGGVPVKRFHRTTHEVETVYVEEHSPAADPGNMVGECWGAGVDASGEFFLFVGYGHPSGAPYYGDGYRHLYAINRSNGLVAQEIQKTPGPSLASDVHGINGMTIVSDYASSVSLAGNISSGFPNSFLPKRSVMSQSLLAPVKGDETVLIFDDATSRDLAIPSPTRGQVIFNRAYAALQTYDGFWRTAGRDVAMDLGAKGYWTPQGGITVDVDTSVTNWYDIVDQYVQTEATNKPTFRMGTGPQGIPCLQFASASSQQLRCDHADFDNFSEFTMTAWVNPTNGNVGVMGKGDYEKAMMIDATPRLRVFAQLSGTNLSYVANQTLTLGEWVHVAFGFSGVGSWDAWINGVQITSFTTITEESGALLDDAAEEVTLGNNIGYFLNGFLGPCAYFNRHLSTAEVLALAKEVF